MENKMHYYNVWIICLFLIFFIQGTTCYSCHTGSGLFDYSYCEYGCCGHYSYSYDTYEYCCANVGGIAAGCVVAGIVVIAIIVTICICYQKQRAATGMVIQPVGNNNAGPTVVMASSNQTSAGYAPYPPMAPQGSSGVPYSQHPPPAYSSGTAYPGAAGEKHPFHPQY